MWRGGSVTALIEISKNIPVYFLIAGMAATFDDARKTIHTLAYGTLTLSVLAFFAGDQMDGRLMISSGKFANPNDLAQTLLLALPFWWLMGAKAGGNAVRRMAAFPAFVVILFVISRTGSRSALIAAAAAGLVFMLHVSFANKMKLLAVGGVAIALAAVMAGSLRSRYTMLFEGEQPTETEMDAPEEGGPSVDKAVGSTESRLGLLRSSVLITLQHPLLGVGPAMFQLAEKDLAEAAGRRANWHDTHNAYTQVSSEAGVPALIFFVGILVLSIRTTHRIHKQCGNNERLQSLAHTALAVEVALAAYSVSSLFSTAAYGNLLPTMAGLAVALERSAAIALRSAQAPAAATAAPPVERRFRRPSLRVQARQ
jgi:O-antigen ligase